MYFFFFTQKTAYEMRISDWSSDVCSSDLVRARHRQALCPRLDGQGDDRLCRARSDRQRQIVARRRLHRRPRHLEKMERQQRRLDHVPAPGGEGLDRKSVVTGKSVSGRVNLGGLRIIKKKKKKT